MIEALAKSAEIGENVKEVKSSFDPDKRIEKSNSFTARQNEGFDPDRRVEKGEPSVGKAEGFDPDKRVEKSDSFAERQNEGFDPDKGVEKKDTADSEKKGLTDEEKEQIKKETGWSDEIINHIDSMEQYEIYKNADLQEAEIDGKKCLVKNIDMDYVDPKTGLTNRELMEKGRSPIDAKTGEKIELHHMGQDKDGPFAELCENSEHGDGNHGTLHPKTDGSWRNETGANENYNNERAEHWKTRAQEA